MNQRTLKRQEKKLLEMRKEVLQRISELEDKANENSVNAPEGVEVFPSHPADIGTDEALRESSSYLLEENYKQLRLIERALEKFKDHTYGICEVCGRKISKQRLEAIPYTRYCKDCAEKLGISD